MNLDQIEEWAMRLAGKGYLVVSVASFIFILWRGTWPIRIATVIMVMAFVVYCVLDPDDLLQEDEDEDEDNKGSSK